MYQMTSIPNKPRISDDCFWRRDGEDDQIIILSREVFALPLILNPTAAQIFLLCDSRNTQEDIARSLCAKFGLTDFRMVLQDVKAQVGYFAEKGIVRA